MASIVPFVPSDPLQLVSVALDGVTYVLRARWNTTDNAWYLDAWERDGTTPIAFGLKLVLGVRLGSTYSHALFAAGMFMLPLDDTGIEPGFADLGSRVLLVHMTADDAIVSGTVN
jgi:hypothetical protein